MLLTALALAAALHAAPQQPDFTWRGTLRAGQTVTIRGINGGITARRTGGTAVVVTATKHARRSDPASVRIEAVPGGEGVTICAIYPSRRPSRCGGGDASLNSEDNNDVSVEFTVEVPDGVKLDAGTVNGGITADGIGADVGARTVNGDVTASGTGVVRAGTGTGRLDVRFGRADWDGEIALRTVNGGIEVTLPPNPDVEVEASSVNGSLQSAFPLTVQGRFGPREMTGTIGRGGRRLKLSTVN